LPVLRQKIIILLFLLTTGRGLMAQEYAFRHLTAAEGLLSDLRIVMTEDRQGRLWIGSDEGINVFDGYQLSAYSLPDNSGLLHNNMLRIYCDRAGTIWIYTAEGIQYKKEKDNRFSKLDTGKDSIDKTACFFGETSDGNLVVVAGNSVHFVDPQLKITQPAALSTLLKKYRSAICIEQFQGDEWFIGFADKLVLVDLKEQKLIKEIDFTHTWAVSRVTDSTILAGSFIKDSVVLVNLHSGKMEAINDWPADDGKRMAGYTAGILAVGNNKFAIGARYDGVYIADLTNRTHTHLVHDFANPASIKSRFCRRIFITRDSVLFVHAKGLSYTPLNKPQFNTIKNIINEKGEKYDGGFTSFVKARDGSYWISTNSHLAKWNRETGICTYYPYHTPEGGPQKFATVRSVVTDKLGRLWVATFGGGLGMLRPDGTFERHLPNPADREHSIASSIQLAITKDQYDNFFVCSNSGFTYFDPVKKTAQNYFNHPKLKKIARKMTNAVMADKNDNLWIAQLDGIFYYDKSRDSLFEIQMPPGIKDKQVNAFCTDRLGKIYAGCWAGLFIIDPATLKITKHLGKGNGLASNNVMSLVCDQLGKIWIIGGIGVARYDPVTGQVEPFDARDGVEQSNHPLCSGYMSPDGEVFIASSDGFNFFHPASLKKDIRPLKVFVTSLELKDSLVSLPELDHTEFKYYQNNFSFTYQSVDFNLAPIIQYRYKLEGFDTAYLYSGKQRTARYTNLPSGKYRFIVEASVNGKDWYANHQKLSFTIRKAVWTTWWFRVLSVAALATIAFFYYRNRLIQIKKQARLRSDYEIKLNELENSALRTQMNPHFIFNSLNTINSFINSNERAQANQYISKFSKLVRLILDHSREKKISLQDELEVAELYMQLEQIRFEGKFQYHIDVRDVAPADTEVPPLIIQPFVENAILHGLLPKGSGGKLDISARKKGAILECTIEDNGIGRAAAKKIRASSGYNRKSHGMEITLKRIELFNKEHGLDQNVTISDIVAEGGTAAGTKVEIPLARVDSF
jgi:ligand-binding sensor domain-containing protein